MWLLAFIQVSDPSKISKLMDHAQAGKIFIIEGQRRTEHFAYTLEEWSLLEQTQPIGEKVPEPTAEELFNTKIETPPDTEEIRYYMDMRHPDIIRAYKGPQDIANPLCARLDRDFMRMRWHYGRGNCASEAACINDKDLRMDQNALIAQNIPIPFQ